MLNTSTPNAGRSHLHIRRLVAMGLFSRSRRPRESKESDAKILKTVRSSSSCTTASSTDSGSETDMEANEVELGFSFSGGGWLMIYMYGVAKALKERGADRNARFIGTSAGALAAMALYLDSDFDAITEVAVEKFVPLARASIRGAFRMREYVHQALFAVKGVELWSKTKVNPRGCQVVYTSLSGMTSRRRGAFESQDDLVNGLLASCTATPIAGFPFRYHGEWVMDGGVFDNQPLFRDEDGVRRTVTITPNAFDSTADIKPSKYIPPWWTMYTPTQDDLRWVYHLGYEDGLAWCDGNGFKSAVQSHTSQRVEMQSTPAPRHQCSIIDYTTVLGQLTGYASCEKLGRLFSLAGSISIYSLLKLELALWMLLEIGFTSFDIVMLMWSAVVAVAVTLLITGAATETLLIEGSIVGAVYLAVCAARVHHKAHEVKNTATWQQVWSSLQAIEPDTKTATVTTGKLHGVMALQACKADLAKHHHDILVDNSLLYRISTMLCV